MRGDRHETVSRAGVRVNDQEETALLDRPESMSGKAQASAGAHFEVPSQSGGSINNVGGNLYVGGGRRRSGSIGRAVAALGLGLFFAGLSLLGAAGVFVYSHTDWTANAVDPEIPGYAIQAVGLTLAGIVLNRFGRLFAGH